MVETEKPFAAGRVGFSLLAALAFLGCARKEPPKQEPSAPAATAAVTASAKPAEIDPKTLISDLGEMKIPATNPQTPEKIALGHQLFFDKRLSSDGTRACYTCHQNEDGTGGHEPLAIGPESKVLTRHSPVMWNVGYLPRFYWDGRADSLEAQMKGAWAGGNLGVGKDNLEKKAKELSKIKGYKQAFAKVFPKEGLTVDTVAQAISAYERTLVCNNTAYDRFAKGEAQALSAEQKEGLGLFMGKAGCVMCHAPPFFSSAYTVASGTYFNTGMGTQGIPEEKVDIGRSKVSENPADWAAFKVPTLRNISRSAPYFHNGSVATLEEAVKFMATGGAANKNKSPLLTDRQLSASELGSLVAFLKSLDCEGKLEVPKLPQ